MGECENCKYEKVIDGLLTNVKELFSKINANDIRQASMETNLTNILSSINEIKAKIDTLASIPARRWDTVVIAVITAAIGIAVGYFFKR
jgi:hypothetical protein